MIGPTINTLSSGDSIGWLAAIVSIVSFGSFGVPMKNEASTSVDVDPLVFQSYKTVMCFLSSFLVILFGIKPSFTPWGLVSGLFWVPAGTAGIYAVRRAGLAISVGIWSSVIVIMSFFWGIFVFHERVRSLLGACSAAAVLIVGLFGMSIFSHAEENSEIVSRTLSTDSSNDSDGLSSLSGDQKLLLVEDNLPKYEKYGTVSYNINLNEQISQRRIFQIGFLRISVYQMGILGAIFNGLWAGTMMVPLHFARANTKGVHFAISFGVGALIINALLWFARFLFYFKRKGSVNNALACLPSFHIRVMWKSGCTAGFLWSIGNMCSMISVSCLGQGIGYSVVQSAMLVSGLWGIFYYHEVEGQRNIQMWFFFACITVVGIVWLSYEHVS